MDCHSAAKLLASVAVLASVASRSCRMSSFLCSFVSAQLSGPRILNLWTNYEQLMQVPPVSLELNCLVACQALVDHVDHLSISNRSSLKPFGKDHHSKRQVTHLAQWPSSSLEAEPCGPLGTFFAADEICHLEMPGISAFLGCLFSETLQIPQRWVMCAAPAKVTAAAAKS